MRYLLIGGPRDGERLEMPDDRPEFKMTVEHPGPPAFLDSSASPDAVLSVSTCVYRREEWRDGRSGRRYVVWVHEDTNDAMAELIAHYKRGPALGMEMQECPVCRGLKRVQVYDGNNYIEERPCDFCHRLGYVERPR